MLLFDQSTGYSIDGEHRFTRCFNVSFVYSYIRSFAGRTIYAFTINPNSNRTPDLLCFVLLCVALPCLVLLILHVEKSKCGGSVFNNGSTTKFHAKYTVATFEPSYFRSSTILSSDILFYIFLSSFSFSLTERLFPSLALSLFYSVHIATHSCASQQLFGYTKRIYDTPEHHTTLCVSHSTHNILNSNRPKRLHLLCDVLRDVGIVLVSFMKFIFGSVCIRSLAFRLLASVLSAR